MISGFSECHHMPLDLQLNPSDKSLYLLVLHAMILRHVAGERAKLLLVLCDILCPLNKVVNSARLRSCMA